MVTLSNPAPGLLLKTKPETDLAVSDGLPNLALTREHHAARQERSLEILCLTGKILHVDAVNRRIPAWRRGKVHTDMSSLTEFRPPGQALTFLEFSLAGL